MHFDNNLGKYLKFCFSNLSSNCSHDFFFVTNHHSNLKKVTNSTMPFVRTRLWPFLARWMQLNRVCNAQLIHFWMFELKCSHTTKLAHRRPILVLDLLLGWCLCIFDFSSRSVGEIFLVLFLISVISLFLFYFIRDDSSPKIRVKNLYTSEQICYFNVM